MLLQNSQGQDNILVHETRDVAMSLTVRPTAPCTPYVSHLPTSLLVNSSSWSHLIYPTTIRQGENSNMVGQSHRPKKKRNRKQSPVALLVMDRGHGSVKCQGLAKTRKKRNGPLGQLGQLSDGYLPRACCTYCETDLRSNVSTLPIGGWPVVLHQLTRSDR